MLDQTFAFITDQTLIILLSVIVILLVILIFDAISTIKKNNKEIKRLKEINENYAISFERVKMEKEWEKEENRKSNILS